jgi:acetamidase/formamidase
MACPIESDPELDTGHALCGPIAVRGAEPGDTLEVEVVGLRPAPWGFTWAGPRPHLPRYNLGLENMTRVPWDIDADRRTARAPSLGMTVPIRPFLGVMGNAPAELGAHSTAPPRRTGGNLDCRELVVGSRLLLPVEVEGALFSTGDGHAAQGDGEVSQTAIECAMEVAELVIRLRKQEYLRCPQAIIAGGYLTMGIGATLDDAAAMALDCMLDYMGRTYELDRVEAMALSSVVVDLRVTQIVNGVVGVHAVLPSDRILIDQDN